MKTTNSLNIVQQFKRNNLNLNDVYSVSKVHVFDIDDMLI